MFQTRPLIGQHAECLNLICCELAHISLNRFSEFTSRKMAIIIIIMFFLERTVLNMEIEKQETLNARITSELRGYLEGINATINERTKTEQ